MNLEQVGEYFSILSKQASRRKLELAAGVLMCASVPLGSCRFAFSASERIIAYQCGTPDGSVPDSHTVKVIEYIPPLSLSGTLRDIDLGEKPGECGNPPSNP